VVFTAHNGRVAICMLSRRQKLAEADEHQTALHRSTACHPRSMPPRQRASHQRPQ
jgi:hypothetical protein